MTDPAQPKKRGRPVGSGKKKAAAKKRKPRSTKSKSKLPKYQAKVSPKWPGGRGTFYCSDLCQDVIEYFAQAPYREMKRLVTHKDGSTSEVTDLVPNPLPTKAGLCAKWGVHRATVNRWEHEHAEFAEVMKVAEEYREHILVANGLAGLYNPAFSIFTAKNVLKWTDKMDLNHGAQQSLRDILDDLDGKDTGLPGK